MSVDLNNANQYCASTTTDFPVGPPGVAHANPWPLAPTQAPAAFTEPQPIAKKTRTLSKNTYIKIESKSREKLEALSHHSNRQIVEFLGHGFYEMKKYQQISIKDAVLIHKISGDEEIFDLSEKAVQRLPVHQGQVDELEPFLPRRGEIIDLNIRDKIHMIVKGRLKSVSSEEAQKLNSYLRKNPFDYKSILTSAIEETEEEVQRSIGTKQQLRSRHLAPTQTPAAFPEPQPSEKTYVKILPDHREKLKALSRESKRQLVEFLGPNFNNMTQMQEQISIKDAVLIHKISGDEKIFDLSEKAVQRFPVHQGQVEELNLFFPRRNEIKDKTIRDKIKGIKTGRVKSVSSDEAQKLNSYLRKNPFDYKSILTSAIQETEEEVKRSKGTKRQLSSEDPVVQSSKRQRTANYNEEPLPVVHAAMPQQLDNPFGFTSDEQTTPSPENSTSESSSASPINSFPDSPFELGFGWTSSPDTSAPSNQEIVPPSIQEIVHHLTMNEEWDSLNT